MSLPETCPFCGSGSELKHADRWVGFTCITTILAGQDARRLQSATCAVLERTRLLARVAELEARCKRLEEAGDKMHWAFMHPFDTAHESVPDAWTKAKEAKP